MTLRINGEERTLPQLGTVAELVAHLGLPAAVLLVEHNGKALQRGEWNETRLGDGDQIEVLKIAAGG